MPQIEVTYESVDGYCEVQTFDTMTEARDFAQRWVGPNPERGQSYAIAGDGVGKITVTGAMLEELF